MKVEGVKVEGVLADGGTRCYGCLVVVHEGEELVQPLAPLGTVAHLVEACDVVRLGGGGGC